MFMTKIKNISLFIFSFCITILIIEIYIRSTGISMPSYVFDDNVIGRTHKPNSEIFEAKAEGFCIDEVNKFGYIGPAYPMKRNINTIRIALLGSSYVEGLQVFLRNRFSYIFEEELSKKLNKKVEVLNFAIGGDDFRGMYLRYIDIVKKYDPDYTLFMVKPSDFSRKKSMPSPELILENGKLEVNHDFRNSSETKMREKFSPIREFGLGNLLKEAFEVYYLDRLPHVLLDKLDFIKSVEKSSNILGDEYSYSDINIAVINELNRGNHFSQSKSIIVDMDGFQERYKDYIQSIHLSTINIYDSLAKYEPNELMYWKASGKMGHWNNFANKVVGHLIAEIFIKFMVENN